VDKPNPGDLLALLSSGAAKGSIAGLPGHSHQLPGVLSPGGLIVPALMRNAAGEYAGAYLTLAEYLDLAELGLSADAVLDYLLDGVSRHSMLMYLAVLNHLHTADAKAAAFQEGFMDVVAPKVRERIMNLLRGDDPRRFLARQPILAAMRFVLEREVDGDDASDKPAIANAAMVTHAVAVGLANEDAVDGERVAGIPKHLFFEVLRASMLYETDDMWSSIDRFVRLWREFGSTLTTFPGRAALEQLLREATGLDIDEMLALGFAQWAHDNSWEPDKPVFLALDYARGVTEEKMTSFRAFVGATFDEYAKAFAGASTSKFDFLPFQTRPVWYTEGGSLSVDSSYLWSRVTAGLYWAVHDAEKARSEHDRHVFTQSFSEAVERLAEASLLPLAPPVLGGAGKTSYTEDEVGAAYGAKRCDLVIDFGSEAMLAEIVSGQLSVPARVYGDLEQFRKDTDRLVWKKCAQLDETARAIRADSAKMMGHNVPAAYRFCPTLVVGGGYPNNPYSVRYVEEELVARGLLQDAFFEPLCVIDLQELESLEALAGHGHKPTDVLRDWKRSDHREVPLRNYLIRAFGGGEFLRPARIKGSVDATFERILALLDLAE
jgi:hypothetical protein